MKEIIEYQTIETIGCLDFKIKELISLGWQPWGNPYIVKEPTNERPFQCQAMVKFKESD